MGEADSIALLRRARERTLQVVADLEGARLIGERGHHLEPPLWELGHIAWFQEYWILRHLDRADPLEDRDGAYDSFRVSYRERWDHDFPDREGMLGYAEEILRRCEQRLAGREADEADRYFYELAALHEAMHAENITLVRQSLGYPIPPAFAAAARPSPQAEPRTDGQPWADPAEPDDIEVPGGVFPLGAPTDSGFVFDNEKWAHDVEVAPFRIARTPVTQGQFAQFVEAGGYSDRAHWDKRGWEWQRKRGTPEPLGWRRVADGWQRRVFDAWQPIGEWLPMIHVNWHEARAYCQWAGRRLPTEIEWEYAASWDAERSVKRGYPWGDEPPDPARANLDGWHGGVVDVRALAAGDSPWGCRQMLGNVWEWTEDVLYAYPGFEPDPYKEYSVPYLGQKPVLRGGAWTTWDHLIRNTWRNFYLRQRRNILAGFRTCAVD